MNFIIKRVQEKVIKLVRGLFNQQIKILYKYVMYIYI